MEFSWQEYWRGLPFPTPRDLPDPRSEPMSLASPALASRFFPTAPPGMSQISASPKITHVGEDGGKGDPCTLLAGMEVGAATMLNSIKVPQKTKNRTTICSSDSTPGYFTEENENTKSEKIHAP